MSEQQLSISEALKAYQYDDEEVENFVSQYPFLLDALERGYQEVERLFGEHLEKVILKVLHDPEIVGDVQLMGYIWTQLDFDEAVKKFDAFDYDWYLHQETKVRSLLNFQLRLGNVNEL